MTYATKLTFKMEEGTIDTVSYWYQDTNSHF